MKSYIFIVAMLLALFGNAAFAEGSTTEDQTAELRNMWEAMSTMAMLEAYANPTTAAALQARFCRDLYDGLLDNDFTKEQAMQIVIAQCNLRSLLLK